jgi:pimeloyl-ACP methyl ester carboxylesterase
MVGSAPSGLYLDVPFNPLEADAEAASAAGDLDRLVELETQMFFDGMGRTPQQVNQKMRRLAVEMNRLAHSHQALQLGKCLPDTNFKAADRLDEIKHPLLMVVGEYDEPYCHAAADYVVEHVPTASKVLIEDAAHLANMDQPEKFQQVVSAFLDRLSTEL